MSFGRSPSNKGRYKQHPEKPGDRRWRWTILKVIPGLPNLRFEVQCDCGNVRTIQGSSFRLGKSKSCGCLKTEMAQAKAAARLAARGALDYERIGGWGKLLHIDAAAQRAWHKAEALDLKSRRDHDSLNRLEVANG